MYTEETEEEIEDQETKQHYFSDKVGKSIENLNT